MYGVPCLAGQPGLGARRRGREEQHSPSKTRWWWARISRALLTTMSTTAESVRSESPARALPSRCRVASTSSRVSSSVRSKPAIRSSAVRASASAGMPSPATGRTDRRRGGPATRPSRPPPGGSTATVCARTPPTDQPSSRYGPCGCNRADLLDVVGGHLLHGGRELPVASVQSAGLQAVHRLVAGRAGRVARSSTS